MHPRTRIHRPRAALLGALALTALLSGAGPAAAEPPSRLATQVTDQVGALDGGRAQVDDALSTLAQDRQVQLWVVFVATFDGQDAVAWADETATTSSLGVDDVLLAVAVDDRAYAYSVDTDSPLTDGDLDAVNRATEEFLAQDDWSGAVVAGAQQIDDELAGPPVLPILLVGVGVVLVVVVVVVLVGRRRRRAELLAGPGPEFAGRPTEEVRTMADQALVRADDAVRASEQELQFAAAEFGDDRTGPFQTVLDRARVDLAAAFTSRQTLEDDEPETEQQQRELLAAVVASCRRVEGTLDDAAQAVDDLRDLVARAPEVLDALQRKLPALAAGIDPARDRVAALAAEFGPTAVASIADAPAQAADRLALAERSVAAARAALADASRSGETVDAVRSAEASTAQAEALLAAVTRAGDDLARAVTELPVALARLRAAAGTPLPTEATATTTTAAGFAGAAAAASAVADAVTAEGSRDPLGGLHRVVEAERVLDAARDAAEEAVSQRRAQQAALDQALVAARAEIAAADDFVNARRGAVGGTARTNLGEAQRHLQAATDLAGADAAAALEHARTADALAERATAAARADAERYAQQRGYGSGPRTGADLDLGSAIGGILLGGGGRRSGWGGSWGGGFSGGGFGGGGFGGSSGRRGGGSSRRSSPSPRSGGGGGRRGRGGRF